MSEPGAAEEFRQEEEFRQWVEVLDRLEAELADSQALLDGSTAIPGAAWQPAVAMPDLPESLVARARDLIDRQAGMLERLESTRQSTRGQLRYVATDATRGLVMGPRFIDQRA